MRYTVQSIKYVVKNFPFLLPFVVLPAFFLAAATDQEAIYCVIETLLSGKPSELHFYHVFHAISVLNFGAWGAALSGVLAIVAMILCGSFLMAMLEKHMRIGKRTFNGIFSKLNDNLLPTCGYLLLLLGIYEFWTLLISALLFVASRIPFALLAYALMSVVYLSLHVVFLYAVNLIYLWLPCMQITGFRAKEALYYSNHLSSPVKWRILFAQMFILLIMECAICLFAWYSASALWFTVFTAVFYCVLIMVYCVRMQIVYFDLDHIDRADLICRYGK